MRLSSVLAVLTVKVVLAAPVVALAQTSPLSPQTMGRLDRLGRLAGAAPFCEALGYTLADHGGQAFSGEISRIATLAGADPRDAQAAVAAAKAREAGEMKTAHDRVQANLNDRASDKSLREFADALAVRCNNAASDPSATVLLKPPPGGVSTVSRRYVDGLLAPYGRAGWQSEHVVAAGALAEAVGACEARQPRSQSRAYLADIRNPLHYPPDISETVLAWLDQQVSKGRDAAKKAAPSAAQCQQMVAKRKAALDRSPVD